MSAIWTWLFSPPGYSSVIDPFTAVFVLVGGAGFVTSAYLAGPGGDRIALSERHLAQLRGRANAGLWIFGAGLVVFGVRALQIDALTLGAPVWLVASSVAVVLFLASTVRWWRGLPVGSMSE
jgi:hypothetical protein